jgi:ABC-type thiamine transport system substrate-binding protein
MVSVLWFRSEQGGMEMIYWVRFYGLCTTLIVLLMAPLVAVAQGSPDQKIVDAAKKEGELVYYTTMTLDQSKMVVDRFQKKYGIKATLFRTGGGPLLNKIFTEARGGRYDWDIVVGRGEMVLPLIERKLVASYRSPETKMIEAELSTRKDTGLRIT